MAIDFNLLQPVDIGGQFLAGLQAGQQQRLQQQQQDEKLARAQRMQQDIAAWKGDMSPERTAGLLMNYPEIKDQIVSSQAVLNDAAKRDRLDFSSRALMLSKAGQKDRVVEMAQQRIDAYRNAGKTKEAAEAEAMLKAYQIDPRVGEGALALDVATLDPELYKNLFGKTDKDYEVVPGVGVVLKRDIERAIAAGESVVQTAIPEAAINDLRRQPNTARQFDEVFGAGSAARVLGMGGTAAPEMDASGTPTTLTRPQYIATVQALGKAKTDAWLRDNNITVSDR